jgi:hypothetical protein
VTYKVTALKKKEKLFNVSKLKRDLPVQDLLLEPCKKGDLLKAFSKGLAV